MTQSVIQFAKLNIPVDIELLQQEVKSLKAGWLHHFNKRHYIGEWTVLSLRSIGGNTEQIIPDGKEDQGYGNTAVLSSLNYIQKFLTQFHCPLMSVRLMNLKSGAEIKEHRDPELSFEKGEARIHIPVFTNPLVEFRSNGLLLNMHAGQCWYVNVNLPHSVQNKGSTDRIHLVIDCVVNDWLREIFANAEVRSIATDSLAVQNIINELRIQNTEYSLRIANELEATLIPASNVSDTDSAFK